MGPHNASTFAVAVAPGEMHVSDSIQRSRVEPLKGL